MNVLLSEKNELIQEQKEMVEEKNRSISDSINYAQRLQKAILPTGEMVNKHIPESFLFFQPKDIVSGDFHWFHVQGDLMHVAVADCTGHGVPGAMVSVVCSNALNSAVNEFGLTAPKDILDKVRDLVIDRFAVGNDQVADGMDIALCSINKKTNELIFAGANNPLWLVREKSAVNKFEESSTVVEGEFALVEFKGDKQPIGEHTSKEPFSQTKIKLLPGDSLYLFTDGYADQFGGPNEKKFKYLPMKRELLGLQHLSMYDQGMKMREIFELWKGTLEQIDDVCLLGVRIGK